MPTSSRRVCRRPIAEPTRRRSGPGRTAARWCLSSWVRCVRVQCAARTKPAGGNRRLASTPLAARRGQRDETAQSALLAVDQQADQHAHAGGNADRRPRMLVHVVVGRACGLLAFSTTTTWTSAAFSLACLRRDMAFSRSSAARSPVLLAACEQVFGVRENGFDIRHQFLLVDFRHCNFRAVMLQVHILAKRLPAGEPGRHTVAVQDCMVNDSQS